MRNKTLKNSMIELMSEVQSQYLDGTDYSTLSEEQKDRYRTSSESILEILSLIPGKIRGRIVLTYEMLEHVLGIKEGKLLTIEDRPESCTVSIVHCDEEASLPVKEGNVIPVTETFLKNSRIYACKKCKDREIAEASQKIFNTGDQVQVFVDGAGIKDGIIIESGQGAHKIKIDDWTGVFGSMFISKKETVNDESEVC